MPSPKNTANVVVFASGRGSNFEALLDHQQNGYFAACTIVGLISDNPTAPALEIAQSRGIAHAAISPRGLARASDFEKKLLAQLADWNADWIVLAGYMRMIGPALLNAYPKRILNIHPSLLPAFPGLNAQKQAYEHGVKVSGCTAHLVDKGMDTGPIVCQRATDISTATSDHEVAQSILKIEHATLALALKILTEQPWQLEGRRINYQPIQEQDQPQ